MKLSRSQGSMALILRGSQTLFDTELTVKVLGLLKNKQPDLWHEYLKTKSKVVVENLIKQEKMFTINENFLVKIFIFSCSFVRSVCISL